MLLIGLVDSGADNSLLDAQYAYALGLDRDQAEVRSSLGAGGNKFESLMWPRAVLELEFKGTRFPFNGSFVEFPKGQEALNLLGRGDFFKHSVVQFWETKGLMNIDSNPDIAEGPIPL